MPYFDAASSAPVHPVARQALLAALDEGWADPARLYRDGRRARMLLDAARQTMAEVIGCRPDELWFTPSGTQAVHLGTLGALAGRSRTGRHLVVSAVEHSSVLHAARRHRASGGTVSEVGVSPTGRVEVEAFAAALRGERASSTAPGDTEASREGVALACLQSANHEVGTLQPVAEVAEMCQRRGVPLLVDAAQSIGRLPVPQGWSVLAASAHKWGGPPGVGLLAVRKGVRFLPTLPHDEREGGRVPGFENVPAIVAAAASLRAVWEEAETENARLATLVDRIRARVPDLVPDAEVVGDPVWRLPHLVTFSCLYVDGEALLTELDRAGFAVSSGSSCTSSTLTPSHVLRAMGVLSEGNVRVSLPYGTPKADVDRFLEVLPGVVRGVREQIGAPSATPVVADSVAPTDSPTQAPVGETPPGPKSIEPALILDTLGRRCPVPVMELARRIDDIEAGGLAAVLSDDAAAGLDIPAWCAMRGHSFEGERPATELGAPKGTAYLVRRAQ